MKKLIWIMLLLVLTACGAEKEDMTEDITVPEIGDVPEDISVTPEMEERGHLVITTAYNDQFVYTPHGIIEETRLQFEKKFPGWTAEIVSMSELAEWPNYVGALNWSGTDSGDQLYFNTLPDVMTGADASQKMPDIVGLRAADRRRLSEEGLLEDMLPLFGSDPESKIDRLLPGVIRAGSDGGSLYVIPSSFSFLSLHLSPGAENYVELVDGPLPSPWTWENAVEYFSPAFEHLDGADSDWRMFSITPQSLAADNALEARALISLESCGKCA